MGEQEDVDLGQTIVDLGDLFCQIDRARHDRDDGLSGNDKSRALKDEFKPRVVELRRILNQGLTGFRDIESNKPSDSPGTLRRLIRIAGCAEAADGAGIGNHAPNQKLRANYWAQYPIPSKAIRVPGLFFQLTGDRKEVGGDGELGWECRIGLTTYDDQEDPVLSRSSLTSLRSTFRKSHSREVVLSALTEVERKAPFKITFFDAMWGENEIGPHGIEEAVLSSAWVEGTNPGIQVSLTREDLLSGDHVWRRSVEELFTALTSTCLSPVLIQSQLSAEPSVFISYRRSSVRYGGELRRNRILDDLESAAREQGFDVFIDRQMSPGIDYQLELLKQVEGAWIYVPLIVPEYVNPEWNDPTAPESRFQNDWVYRELDAIPQSAQIVPLLLDARPSEYIGHVERKNLPALHELNAIPLNPDETGSINEYETSSFKQILQERREH